MKNGSLIVTRISISPGNYLCRKTIPAKNQSLLQTKPLLPLLMLMPGKSPRSLPSRQGMVRRFMPKYLNRQQVKKITPLFYLCMARAIYKMFIMAGAVISGNTCLIIYWPTRAIRLWILTTAPAAAMVVIGVPASIDLWAEKIWMIM